MSDPFLLGSTPPPVVLGPPIRDPDAPWRLSWGCGPVVCEPWHHSDIRWWPGMEVDSDPTLTTWDHQGPIQVGLPWADGTFAGIVAHHSLQALPWPDLMPALVELRRLLARGGTLRLSVPDLLAGVDSLGRNEAEMFAVADVHEASVDGKFCLWVSQAGATRSVFTGAWLTELVTRAGFAEVTRCAHGETAYGPEWITELDNRPAESLYVEARK